MQEMLFILNTGHRHHTMPVISEEKQQKWSSSGFEESFSRSKSRYQQQAHSTRSAAYCLRFGLPRANFQTITAAITAST
jgi:hypothetical protein